MKVLLWRLRCRPRPAPSCPLSHSSRSFYHKTDLLPRPSLSLENFRFATTAIGNTSAFPKPRKDAALDQRGRYRFYSHSASPNMAEARWSGQLVRKTFLDYFKERGHTIGMPSPPRLRFPSIPDLASSISPSLPLWAARPCFREQWN